MADNSAIEWTDATWNPTVGCSVLSPGCTNCYAMNVAHRFGGSMPWSPAGKNAKYAGLTKQVNFNAVWTGKVRLDESALTKPLGWKKPRRIFVNSMSDLFHESLPDEAIDRVFAVMALCPQHTFQVLTKRADRMRNYCLGASDADRRVWAAANEIMDTIWALAQHGASWGGETPWPLRNVWLGVSVEDQQRADERIPLLLDTPASKRFISAEPLLGPVDLGRLKIAEDQNAALYCDGINGVHFAECPVEGGLETIGKGEWHSPALPPVHPGLDWVIVGGESGPGARPMHPDWARSLRDQCQAAGVAFHFKQWGALAPIGYPDGVTDPKEHLWIRVGKKAAGRLLDGRTWDEFPA